jgi:hypothetical protein
VAKIKVPDDDDDDLDYGSDGNDGRQLCVRCGLNPAAAVEETCYVRLAVCPFCALRLGRLAGQAMAAVATGDGDQEALHRKALDQLVMFYCAAASIDPKIGEDAIENCPKLGGKPALHPAGEEN